MIAREFNISENDIFLLFNSFFKGRIAIRDTFNTLQDTITSSYEELSQNVSTRRCSMQFYGCA